MIEKKPVNLVTEEHRSYYLERLVYWQDMFSLKDWRINLSKIPSKYMGEVFKIDLEQRKASFKIGSDFGAATEVNDLTIDDLARHEMMHLWLHEYGVLCRDASPSVIMSAEHRLINTLDHWSVSRRDDQAWSHKMEDTYADLQQQMF
jgi:hypothetical protein